MIGTQVEISRLHFPVRSLGPGERIGIWVQGCSIRCPGCISLDTWATGRGLTTVEAVLAAIDPWLPSATGFTISGGEPFDQPNALMALLCGLREKHAGDILIYSGHAFEELPIDQFYGLIDALISDPLRLDRSQELPLRGSDNQRLHFLTELGREKFSYAVAPTGAEHVLDVMFDDDNGDVFLAGIPRRGDLVRLQRILEQSGHRADITEDKRHQP